MKKKTNKKKTINNKLNKKDINWIVHYVSDSACMFCKDEHKQYYKSGLCDAHTHGLRELYKHPEFQAVLDLGMEVIRPILNTLGCMVRDGRRFKSGELVSGVLMGYDVRLDEFKDSSGKKILRVMLPDKMHNFPDNENCSPLFKLQALMNISIA